MVDKYQNFDELFTSERRDVDFRVRCFDRKSAIVLMAPHGGHIEPETSSIAEAIAGDQYSFYAFEGLRALSRELHITSEHFDEPDALALLAGARAAVTIHGRQDGIDPVAIWLGGLDIELRDAIERALHAAGFKVKTEGTSMPGVAKSNICNRGKSEKGVQLELPFSLRDELRKSPARLKQFCDAVRVTLGQAKR